MSKRRIRGDPARTGEDGHLRYAYPPTPRLVARVALSSPHPGLRPARDLAAHCRGSSDPVLALVDRRDIGTLLPRAIAFTAIVRVLWLPDAWRTEVPGLCASPLEVGNYISGDLMHSITCVVASGTRRAVMFDALRAPMGDSTSETALTPFVLLWVCSALVSIVRYALTYDFHLTLQCAHIGSGSNYCAHALYTEKELVDARAAAERRLDVKRAVTESRVVSLDYRPDLPLAVIHERW